MEFTLIHSRGRLRDADNAQSSCKELLDALVHGGVLVDDGPAHVELVAIVQVYGAQPDVLIEVWPARAPRVRRQDEPRCGYSSPMILHVSARTLSIQTSRASQ